MAKVSLVCLANSTKLSGRCIAGIRADNGNWVRPVGPGDGTVFRSHYLLSDGSEPALLDLISLDLGQPCPLPYQRENHSFGSEAWQLLDRPAPSALAPHLRAATVFGPDLLIGSADRVRVSELDPSQSADSLALVFPNVLNWYKTQNIRGNDQIRAVFALGAVEYSLVVTDPLWKARFQTVPMGHHTNADVGLPEGERLLITVSLAGPLNGICYKLVAAVMQLPHEWLSALS